MDGYGTVDWNQYGLRLSTVTIYMGELGTVIDRYGTLNWYGLRLGTVTIYMG